jgi:hypothetical protein
MKKLIILAIFLILSLASKLNASSCLTNLKLNKEITTFDLSRFETQQEIAGIDLIEIPVEFFCKQTKAKGTDIQLFFIDGNIIDMREIEQYLVRDNNIIYTYENIKGDGEDFIKIKEIFEIIDKTFEDHMLKYSLEEESKQG